MFNYALITAGGLGSRLLPLTQYLPKALIEVDGVPMISRLIRQLKPYIDFIAITAGYKGEQVCSSVFAENVSAVFNTRSRGNAWWIFNTPMKHINAPVIVFTCDLLLSLDLDYVHQAYLDAGSPLCLMVPVTPYENAAGDYIKGRNGIVESFSRTDVTELLASGIYVINPFAANAIMDAADGTDQLWNNLIETGNLFYSGLYPGAWHTIDSLQQLSQYLSPSNYLTR